MSLIELKGIGKGRLEALAGVGVETLADMAGLDEAGVEEVAEALGVSVEQVGLWQVEAALAISVRELNKSEPDVDEEVDTEVLVERDPREVVLVRVLCERGLLNGRAVWRGEAHRTSYRRYLEAVRDNPDGYVLVV